MSFLVDSRQFEGFRSPFATGFPGFWAAFEDGVLLRYCPLAESRLKPPPKLNMLQKYNTKKTLDMGSRFWYTVSMVMRKKRSDRNHVLYMVTCEDTGDTYVGLTVALGQAYLKSVKIRWQKHMSRARCENKDWNFCNALRVLDECDWRYQVLEVVRGRKNAHQRERELIRDLNPTLNTF